MSKDYIKNIKDIFKDYETYPFKRKPEQQPAIQMNIDEFALYIRQLNLQFKNKEQDRGEEE